MMEDDDIELDLDLEGLEVDETTGEVRRVSKPAAPASVSTKLGIDFRGSASLLKDYQKCGARAYARITKQPGIKSIKLFNGSAVHSALEMYVKEQSDPMKVYETELIKAAEENKISLGTTEAAEARQVGILCVASGVAILNTPSKAGVPLWKRLDPQYVEKYFIITRNGRKYSGKIDLVAFQEDPSKYVVTDFKTGGHAPDQYTLDNDIQFDMYPYALYHDKACTKTYGTWAQREVYLHLRGQVQEKDVKTGRRLSLAQREKLPPMTRKPLKYDFPTQRTLAQVEEKFENVLEPIMIQMENNVFIRNFEPSYGCQSCEYFKPDPLDKKMGKCGVDMPYDHKTEKDVKNIDLIQLVAEVRKEEAKAKEALPPLKPYPEEKPARPIREKKKR